MPETNINVKSAYMNMGPTGSSLLAHHFFKCYTDFEPPSKFPLVQFFLLSRAIEHALKANLYGSKTVVWIDKNFIGKKGHNLEFLYGELKNNYKTLGKREIKLLIEVNKIYKDKNFEYISINVIRNAITRYSRFPDIKKLETLTKKLIDDLCVQLNN